MARASAPTPANARQGRTSENPALLAALLHPFFCCLHLESAVFLDFSIATHGPFGFPFPRNSRHPKLVTPQAPLLPQTCLGSYSEPLGRRLCVIWGFWPLNLLGKFCGVENLSTLPCQHVAKRAPHRFRPAAKPDRNAVEGLTNPHKAELQPSSPAQPPTPSRDLIMKPYEVN